MVWFVIHLFAYVSVAGFCTATWALTTGSFEDVERISRDVGLASELGFWPIWVVLGGAALLVVHLGGLLAVHLFGGRARRRRARIARRALAAVTPPHARARHRAHDEATRPPPPPPAGRPWVTVMFVDIVGSTTLNEELGDEQWREVLSGYREMVRRAIAAADGHEMGTQGDGFLVRFPTPAGAVAAAVEIQRRLAAARAASALDLRARIGLHAGQAVEDEGDLVGQVVNLAARVMATAEPSQIVVTEPVADQLGNLVPCDDLGLVVLRGVARQRHLLAVRWDDDGPPPPDRPVGELGAPAP